MATLKKLEIVYKMWNLETCCQLELNAHQNPFSCIQTSNCKVENPCVQITEDESKLLWKFALCRSQDNWAVHTLGLWLFDLMLDENHIWKYKAWSWVKICVFVVCDKSQTVVSRDSSQNAPGQILMAGSPSRQGSSLKTWPWVHWRLDGQASLSWCQGTPTASVQLYLVCWVLVYCWQRKVNVSEKWSTW